MWDERTGGTYPRASARKGYASGRDSGPMGLGRTLGLDASHVDGPLRRPGVVLLTRSPAGVPSAPYGVKPPTGEPDAGNPPVRFGGRGSQVGNWLSLPLSLRRPLFSGLRGDESLFSRHSPLAPAAGPVYNTPLKWAWGSPHRRPARGRKR